MNRIPLLISAAALTAATTLPAHAVATSSATLGPLTITLFDLDPLDGIAPSLTFGNPYGYGSYADAYAYDSDPYGYDLQYVWGTTEFEPLSTSAATVMASATAVVSGSGDAAGTMLTVTGSAAGTMNTQPFSYQYSQYSATAYAPSYYYYSSFSLSANTLLLVSATASVSGSVTSAFDPANGYQYESAYANTTLYLSGPGASGSGGGSQSSSDGLSLSIGNATVYDAACVYGYCYGPNSGADSRTLSVSFVNASGADLAGYFQAYANVSGTSYVQAVPEPETYAMMLAGLLSLGFLTRRRPHA